MQKKRRSTYINQYQTYQSLGMLIKDNKKEDNIQKFYKILKKFLNKIYSFL